MGAKNILQKGNHQGGGGDFPLHVVSVGLGPWRELLDSALLCENRPDSDGKEENDKVLDSPAVGSTLCVLAVLEVGVDWRARVRVSLVLELGANRSVLRSAVLDCGGDRLRVYNQAWLKIDH